MSDHFTPSHFQEAPGAPLSVPKVLLLDDNDAVRKLLAKVLNTEGISTLDTGSEAEAFKLLHHPDVRLLIQDFSRGPGTLGGLAFWQKMRASEECCHIPVIIISGTDQKRITDAFAAVYSEPLEELVILRSKPICLEDFRGLIPTMRCLMSLS